MQATYGSSRPLAVSQSALTRAEEKSTGKSNALDNALIKGNFSSQELDTMLWIGICSLGLGLPLILGYVAAKLVSDGAENKAQNELRQKEVAELASAIVLTDIDNRTSEPTLSLVIGKNAISKGSQVTYKEIYGEVYVKIGDTDPVLTRFSTLQELKDFWKQDMKENGPAYKAISNPNNGNGLGKLSMVDVALAEVNPDLDPDLCRQNLFLERAFEVAYRDYLVINSQYQSNGSSPIHHSIGLSDANAKPLATAASNIILANPNATLDQKNAAALILKNAVQIKVIAMAYATAPDKKEIMNSYCTQAAQYLDEAQNAMDIINANSNLVPFDPAKTPPAEFGIGVLTFLAPKDPNLAEEAEKFNLNFKELQKQNEAPQAPVFNPIHIKTSVQGSREPAKLKKLEAVATKSEVEAGEIRKKTAKLREKEETRKAEEAAKKERKPEGQETDASKTSLVKKVTKRVKGVGEDLKEITKNALPSRKHKDRADESPKAQEQNKDPQVKRHTAPVAERSQVQDNPRRGRGRLLETVKEMEKQAADFKAQTAKLET